MLFRSAVQPATTATRHSGNAENRQLERIGTSPFRRSSNEVSALAAQHCSSATGTGSPVSRRTGTPMRHRPRPGRARKCQDDAGNPRYATIRPSAPPEPRCEKKRSRRDAVQWELAVASPMPILFAWSNSAWRKSRCERPLRDRDLSTAAITSGPTSYRSPEIATPACITMSLE